VSNGTSRSMRTQCGAAARCRSVTGRMVNPRANLSSPVAGSAAVVSRPCLEGVRSRSELFPIYRDRQGRHGKRNPHGRAQDRRALSQAISLHACREGSALQAHGRVIAPVFQRNHGSGRIIVGHGSPCRQVWFRMVTEGGTRRKLMLDRLTGELRWFLLGATGSRADLPGRAVRANAWRA